MKGFTLIELMIVMALMSVLATLGLSSYKVYMARVHRAEVQQFMLSVANRQETYHLDTRRYGSLDDLRLSVPAAVAAYYRLELEPDNASQPPGYTLKAIPQAVIQTEPVLELDHLGHATPAELWQGVQP